MTTVRVTGMVMGLPVAPAAVMTTLPLYVPVESEPTVADTVTVPGVEPLAGVAVSQLPPLVVEAEVVKLMTPGVPVTETVCVTAVVLPCAPVKLTVVGVAATVPALTVKLTGTVTVLEEPAALMVMDPW